MKITQVLKLFALLFSLTLVAAACSSDSGTESEAEETTAGTEASDPETEASDPETESGDPEVADLSVGVIPITDVLAIHSGIKDGSFEEAGLTVTTADAAGGAAIIPGVTSGDFQVGFSNVYSILAAQEAGLDVRIIAPGNYVGDEDFSGLLSIEFDSTEELEGTTIAVNTLGNLVETTVRETLDKAGVDPESVEFIEIPFPEMVGALEAGTVDAIAPVEPFVGLAEAAEANLLANPFSDSQPDMLVGAWFTTGEFADTNPATVDAFVTTLNAANDQLGADRDLANELAVEFTATPSIEAAAAATFPIWRSDLDEGSLEKSVEIGEKWGVLDGTADIDALVNG